MQFVQIKSREDSENNSKTLLSSSGLSRCRGKPGTIACGRVVIWGLETRPLFFWFASGD